MNYSQPDFYKFGADSLFLANTFNSFEIISPSEKNSVLDLCCGCGIIGLEILKNNPKIKLTSLDLQLEYKRHFLKNIKMLNLEGSKANFITAPFNDLNDNLFKQKYDYIVSNPPYYNSNKCRLPPNQNKKKAKFFVVDNFENYIETIYHCLKDDGFFWLLRTSKINNDVTDFNKISSLFVQTDIFNGNGFELFRFMKLNKY